MAGGQVVIGNGDVAACREPRQGCGPTLRGKLVHDAAMIIGYGLRSRNEFVIRGFNLYDDIEIVGRLDKEQLGWSGRLVEE